MVTLDSQLITNQALQVVAKINAGQGKLHYTKVVFSSDDYSNSSDADVKNLTGLKNNELSTEPTTYVTDNNTTKIIGTADNHGLNNSFDVKTYGLFAQVDDGNEFLFAVYLSSTADYLPADNGNNNTEVSYGFGFKFSDQAKIDVTDYNVISVSQKDLRNAISQANDYTDGKLSTIDLSSSVNQAKSYADTQDKATLQSATNYTDKKVGSIDLSSAVNQSKQYTDDAVATKADKKIVDLLKNSSLQVKQNVKGMDFDKITEDGIYPIYNGRPGSNAANYGWQQLLVVVNVNGTAFQFECMFDGNGQTHLYSRVAGTSWRKQADDADLADALNKITKKADISYVDVQDKQTLQSAESYADKKSQYFDDAGQAYKALSTVENNTFVFSKGKDGEKYSDIWYKDSNGQIHKVQGDQDQPSGVSISVVNQYPKGFNYTISVANTGIDSNLTYKVFYKKQNEDNWQEMDNVAQTGLISGATAVGNYDIKAQASNVAGNAESDVISASTIDGRIFGVSWNQGSDPTLTRTDSSVGITSSDQFASACPITKKMHTVTDDYGNQFRRVPKFYIRKTQTSGLSTWQISLVNHGDGWYLPKCFYDFNNNAELPYVDIGQYLANVNNGKLESKQGNTPTSGLTIQDARQYARNCGAGYQQLDIHVLDVIQVLFIVQYATLNSQSVWNDSYSGSNGGGVFYFWLYNFTDELYQFIDGIGINNGQIWICDNPDQYANSMFSYPYHQVGYNLTGSSGYITANGYDPANPEVSLPVSTGGGENSYYSDYVWPSGSNCEMYWGGSGSSSHYGLWYSEFDVSFGNTDSYIGCRLIRKPV